MLRTWVQSISLLALHPQISLQGPLYRNLPSVRGVSVREGILCALDLEINLRAHGFETK